MAFTVLLLACGDELTDVDPLPAGNGYRDAPWTLHPDSPFTRRIGGHPPGSRYIYYNDLPLFPLPEEPGFAQDGAVVVKEVYDEDEALSYIAVMRRLPEHAQAAEDGWVYSLSRDNGKTETVYELCETCHIDPLSIGSLWAPPPR